VITLLGVGHVFDLRAQVRDAILRRGPAVVGLELDAPRYYALRHRGQPRGGPPMVRLLAAIQERIAHEYGTEVGDEMLSAASAAQEIGAALVLIDMDAGQVTRRLLRELGYWGRLKLLWAVVAGLFVPRGKVEAEIQRYEEDQEAYVAEFSRHFPAAKRILIDERDEHMARTLRELDGRYGRVVAVVGDGHVDGLRARLADLSPEVIRLKDLRNATPETGAEFRYSFTYRG